MSSYSTLDHSVHHLLPGAGLDQLSVSREAARRFALVQAVSRHPSPAVPRRSARVWRRVRRVAARPA